MTKHKLLPFFTRPLAILSLLLISACATYQPQTAATLKKATPVASPVHTFYIAGGLGNAPNGNPKMQQLLQTHLAKAPKESTLLFAGDYIAEDVAQPENNQQLLQTQLDLAQNFKGKTYFIPGDNEWSSLNTKDIEWVEDYIKEKDYKNIEVEPNNVCPLEYREISETVDMVLVDSNWFISNWDRVEGINQKCTDIVTKRRFAEELEGYMKDARGKNLVIVMHHPIFSNGTYARNNLGGFSTKQLNFPRYNQLRILVSSLAKDLDRVTIVSGHEESLQYLSGGGIHQIISGSMGGTKPTKRAQDNITAVGGQIEYEGKFTHGKEGFAILRYFEDGSSTVEFITEDSTPSFAVTEVFPKEEKVINNPTFTNSTIQVPVIADKNKTEKSGFYNFIWGNRYRSKYAIPVTANITMLDTLKGGLEVKKAGGGHQSFSAQLVDEEGREFALRGLKKDALKFLKFRVRGIAYTNDEYKGTFAEEVVSDFFTTAHPYMQMTLYPLAKAAAVNQANTQLYYLPQQKRLNPLPAEYGDGLYFIEERPNDKHMDFDGYHFAAPNQEGEMVNDESMTDVLEKLKEDEKYSIDQRAYIRARLFDMLIGDWDRHQDQWRWLEYEVSDDEVKFIPVPRDRDNAFSKFDGIAVPIIQLFLPDVRFWQSYDEDIKNVKWFNQEANNLDRALLNKYSTEVWLEEANYIKENITDAVIEEAFSRLPKEVQDETSASIKSNLKKRLQKLPEIAKTYASYLNETVSVHGTIKDDKFIITRLPKGKTKVIIERKLKDKPNTVFYERTFDASETDEIWLYGLDENDDFEVSGDGDNEIMIRLIGGYGKDDFNITNTKKLKVYDWQHEKTEFEAKTPAKQFTNLYETNTFHWRYFVENNNILVPNIGFRTDDGLFVGATDTYTNNGFNGNPFRYQHRLSANYFFDFQAIELDYKGTFANIIPKWNLEIGGYFTSSGYATNFFGFGNETTHDDDAVEREFNRARTQQIRGDVGITNNYFKFKGIFESFQVEETPGRFFVSENPEVPEALFDAQNYAGAEGSLSFKNQDAADFPTRGISLDVAVGYKQNLDLEDNKFGYAEAKIGVNQKLIASGNLVLGTTIAGKTNFGGDYFFYHAPSIGGDNGLRGYRDERFTGDTYFYQSTDLKVRLKRFVTGVIPITVGVYGGFDYGRVWEENDTSDIWHTSQGGGVWISGLNSIGLNVGYFVSEEDAIIQVGLGFGF